MADSDNPASRLYVQLETIRNKVQTTALNNAQGIKLRAVLAGVVGCKPTETANLYLFLVDLAKLAQKSVDSIQTVPHINHKTYIAPLQKLEEDLLSTTIDLSAKTFTTRVLSDVILLSVRACADMLSTVYVDTTISNNEINGLQKDTDSLLSDVLKVNLPPDLKEFLVDCLEKMRQALLGYKIRGNQGLKEVIESALGASFLRRDEIIEQTKDDQEKRKTFERFFALIEKATKILSFAEKVKTLAAPAITLLLPPK
ncbi:MAG: hypothetical protein Q8L64_01760 [bacterium]|nr:hypothetical protein [bacterium]